MFPTLIQIPSLPRYLSMAILVVLFACRKDKIDHDPNLVASIDTFSEIGGRVDWNHRTNKVLVDQEHNGRWDTYICDPDKSGMENLTAKMTGKTYGDQKVRKWQHRGQPDFHPSGDYLVFQVMNEHASSDPKTEELLSLGVNNDLWFMHSDGTHIQKLTNNPSGHAVLHPHFSHQGDRIMWSEKYTNDGDASKFGAWRIKVADFSIDTNGMANLTNIRIIQPKGAKWYESHSFSRDGTKIYFSGNLTTEFKANDIYQYDLNTGELQNLTKSPSTWEEMFNLRPGSNDFCYISSEFFDWNSTLGWGTLRTELYLNMDGVPHQLTYFNQLKEHNHRRLTKKHQFIGDHCWGPEGKTILAVLAEASIGRTGSKVVRINLK